ncbi:MAG: carbon-nitrogen hydrolase family protein [Candidatus Brocadiia bacterium]
MALLKVGLLQMSSHGMDQDANLAKGEEFCRRASAMGADVALFPEMWSIGYTLPDPEDADAVADWRTRAIERDDAFVAHFRRLARELDMAIAITYLEATPDGPRNSVSLIDRKGQIVLTYSKVHTCDFGHEAALTPGDGFHVAELDTAAGTVKVGAMICYDREFPESARILMLQGAEIILTPNACGLEQHRIGQFKARAYENMVGLAMTNYPPPKANGHSMAVDGAAVGGDGKSRDTLLVEAGPHEDVYLATFDLDELRSYRERNVWGNAYRKPARYGLLTSESVEAPFVRPDARR